MLDEVPLRARKRPRTEDFDIGETSLNLVACSTEDLSPPGMTPQYEAALDFVSRLYSSPEELAAETPASPSTPSYSS